MLPEELTERAKWLVKLRWWSVGGILSIGLLIRLFIFYDIIPFLGIAALVLFYNILALLYIKIVESKGRISLVSLKVMLNLQIVLDQLSFATCVRLSGGIESALLTAFLLTLTAASLVLSPLESYLQATFAILLVGSITLLEYYHIIPHIHQGTGPETGLYENPSYVFITLLTFGCFIYICTYIATHISGQLRKKGKELALSVKRLSEKVEEVAALREIGLKLTSSLNLTTVLESIADSALKLAGATNVHIFLYDESSGELKFGAGLWAPDEGREPLTKVREDGLTATVVRSGKPIVINDAEKHPLYATPEARRWGIKAIASFPLKKGPSTLGALNVAFLYPHTFTEDEIRALSLLADQAAIAIENARLFNDVSQRFYELSTLQEVSTATVSELDLESVLNLAVESVAKLTNAQTTSVCLLDPGGETRTYVAAYGVNAEKLIGWRLPADRGVHGIVIRTGEAVVVNDVFGDERTSKDVAEAADIKRALIAPLKVKGKVLGCLAAFNKLEDKFFTEHDKRLLSTFANQVAIAIENARLYGELGESLRELKRTQAQLIQSAKLSAIGELVAGVAHELNNPLTTIMGFAQLLQGEELSKGVKEDLEKIAKAAMRCRRIVGNLLTFARQRKPERMPVNVNEVIERILELRAYQFRMNNIELVRDLEEGLPLMMADPYQLEQVFLNIINNAYEAMESSPTQGKLIVRTRKKDNNVRIEFIDNGPGIPPDVMPKIFDPFFTTKEGGTGLGLSVSYGIVQEHGGRIWAESEPGKGATFFVELPLDQSSL
jgi:signal transduction histidine kinase